MYGHHFAKTPHLEYQQLLELQVPPILLTHRWFHIQQYFLLEPDVNLRTDQFLSKMVDAESTLLSWLDSD